MFTATLQFDIMCVRL